MRVLKKQDNERKNESKQTAQYSINGSVTTTTIEAVKREIRRLKKRKREIRTRDAATFEEAAISRGRLGKEAKKRRRKNSAMPVTNTLSEGYTGGV